MAKSKSAINFEYGTLMAFCAIVNAIPYAVAMKLASAIAWTAVCVLGFKRKRTYGRIRSVFPGLGNREVRRIAVRSLTNVLQSGVEMIRAPRLTREWMDRHVADGAHYKQLLQEYVDEGKGVVIMVPHSGNWYMAAWSMAKYGLPLCAIAARQRNPKVDRWMARQYGDIEVLDRSERDTIGKIIDRLEHGKAFAILSDLRVRKPDVDAEFLGGHANVSRAGAKFAVRAGAPIVVAQMYREGGKHHFNHIATLRPDASAKDANEEARRITKEVMKLFDKAIRERPGDWFWYNKRWVLEEVKS